MRIAIICLAGAIALSAGCSKKPAESSASTGAKATAAAGEAVGEPKSVLGRMMTAPRRKSGLWESSMNTSAGPGMKMTAQQCVDSATDKDLAWHGPHSQSKNCEKTEFHPGVGGVSFDSVCKVGSRTVTTHGVVTGDFDKAYDLDLTSHFDPPTPGMGADMKMTMKARWLGPCPAGMKAGEVKASVAGMNFSAKGR